MQYDGFVVGPGIRALRKKSTYTLEALSEKTGISVSNIKRIEQGNRNLSMRNLYALMDVYETDANTLLDLDSVSDSIDSKLKRLPEEKRRFLVKSFEFMLEEALQSA